MKPIYLSLALLLVATTALAEMRTWTAQNGKTFEGELVSENGDMVSLKGQNGKIIKIPIAGLSQEDQDYIAFNRPISLIIDTGKEKIKFGDREYYSLTTKIRHTGSNDIKKQLDLYTFILDEGDNLVASSCTKNIHVSEKEAEFSSSKNLSACFNKENYDDFLVLIVDSADHIVACESSNKILMKDVERQRHLLLAEKWKSFLSPLLQANKSSSESETLRYRFIDITTIVETNNAGKIKTSSDHYYDATIDFAYSKLLGITDSFVTSGFKMDGLPSYNTIAKRLPTMAFPFCPVKQSPAITLFAPTTPDTRGGPKDFEYIVKSHLSFPNALCRRLIWFAHYQGSVEYDSDITFRFVGQATGTMIVSLNGKTVLNSNAKKKNIRFGAKASGNQKCIIPFPLDESPTSFSGQWNTIKKGEPMQLDIVMAPPREGMFSNMLFVQVRGEKYLENAAGGPILPLFCAGKNLSQELIDCVYAEVCPKGTKPPEPVVFKVVPKE